MSRGIRARHSAGVEATHYLLPKVFNIPETKLEILLKHQLEWNLGIVKQHHSLANKWSKTSIFIIHCAIKKQNRCWRVHVLEMFHD